MVQERFSSMAEHARQLSKRRDKVSQALSTLRDIK